MNFNHQMIQSTRDFFTEGQQGYDAIETSLEFLLRAVDMMKTDNREDLLGVIELVDASAMELESVIEAIPTGTKEDTWTIFQAVASLNLCCLSFIHHGIYLKLPDIEPAVDYDTIVSMLSALMMSLDYDAKKKASLVSALTNMEEWVVRLAHDALK